MGHSFDVLLFFWVKKGDNNGELRKERARELLWGVAAFPRGWPAAPARPRDVSISPGERGPAGCVWAGSNPQHSTREAEVWGGRGISVTGASPGDSAPATGLCSPPVGAA